MLIATKPVIDLGKLRYGKKYSFIYTLLNDGEKNISVEKLVIGCSSCTSARINNTLIEKGENGYLEVDFTPGSTGLQSKKITVIYREEGGDQQSLPVSFIGVVDE